MTAVPRIFGAKLPMGTIPEALEYLERIPNFAPFILGNGLLEGMRQGIRGTVSPPLAATKFVMRRGLASCASRCCAARDDGDLPHNVR